MRNAAVGTAWVALLATAAVACRPLDVDDSPPPPPPLEDDAEVVVSGRLTMPDGSPAAGVTVGMMDDRGGLNVLLEFTAAVASFGIMCLARTVGVCQGDWTTTTSEDGRYSFTMTGKDTKNLFGNPSDFVLSAQLPSPDGQLAGPVVSTRFPVLHPEVTVPELAFWEPGTLDVSAGTQGVEYAGAELPGDGTPEYTVALVDEEELVWSQPGSPEGHIDARAVTDLQGAFQVSAVTQREVDRATFTTTHQSHQVPVDSALGPPPSRGATCVVAGREPVVPDPCPVTDGRYDDDLPQALFRCPRKPDSRTRQKSCEADTWVSVDLGSRRAIETLFVHGLTVSRLPTNQDEPVVLVETSSDGVRWTEHTASEPEPFDRIDLPDGVAARYLRLRLEDESNHFNDLAELSVWP